MRSEQLIKNIFFYTSLVIGIIGNLTVVYGYYTGELLKEHPLAMFLCVLIFTISPLLILKEERRIV